jgi:hypothetical protein
MSKRLDRIFVSCVSCEFGTVRQALRVYLTRADCDVKVQEDFALSPDTTLIKLDDYIQHAAAVIHLIGAEAGSMVEADVVDDYLRRHEVFLDGCRVCVRPPETGRVCPTRSGRLSLRSTIASRSSPTSIVPCRPTSARHTRRRAI